MLRARIMAIIVAMLPIGACSWRTHLVITNSTDGAISLVYVLKPFDLAQRNPETGLKKGYQYEPPRIVPVDHFDKHPTEYPEALHTFDVKRGTITVSVPPKTTIWVASVPNYQEPWYERGASYLNLARLTIYKKDGVSTMEGIELMKAFKNYHGPMRHSLYAMEIK